MVFFNYALRKLNTKIVYYGPGLCGKTTNLQWIHDHFEGGEKGKMVSLATEGDRTIFFDLLPLEIGTIRGMDVTLQLYTVPGQVHYNATRQLVLRGADGVVFVADSQRTMKNSNIESLKNLEENLALQGVDLSKFPHVLQFNKRDLSDVMDLDEMDRQINQNSVPFFEAVAIEGIGVEDTLGGIVKLVMRSLRDRYETQGDRLSTTTFVSPPSPAVPRVPVVPQAPTVAPTWEPPAARTPSAMPEVKVPAASSPPPASEPTPEAVQEDLLETRPTTEEESSPDDEATGVYAFSATEDHETLMVDEHEDWVADEPTNPGIAELVEEPEMSFDELADDGAQEMDQIDTQTGVLFAPDDVDEAPGDSGFEDEGSGPSLDRSAPPVADAAPEDSPAVDSRTGDVEDDVSTPGVEAETGTDPYADTVPPDYLKGESLSTTDVSVSTEVDELVSAVLRPEEAESPEALREESPFDSAADDGIENEPEFADEAQPVADEDRISGASEPASGLIEDASGLEEGTPGGGDLPVARPVFVGEDEGEREDEASLGAGAAYVFDESPVQEAVVEEVLTSSSPSTPDIREARGASAPIFVGDGDPFLMDEEEAPALEIAPVEVSPMPFRKHENSLALKLTGKGAIVESGEVRALDIEVPVPGSWIGNRRVTLQLRLTLAPATEDDDE